MAAAGGLPLSGSFVQLEPPVRLDTLALWFGPLAILLAGGLGAAIYIRGRKPATVTALSADDEAEVSRLLNTDKAN